jgi:hypothetical protein
MEISEEKLAFFIEPHDWKQHNKIYYEVNNSSNNQN